MKTDTRKSYSAPRLTEFGHIESLTQGIKLLGVSDGVGQLTPFPMGDDDDDGGDTGS